MFNIYLSLISAIIIQLIVIDSVFSSVAFKKDNNFELNNHIVNILELLLMLGVSGLTCYYFLHNVFDNLTLTFIILLIGALIFFRWLVYKTNVLAQYVGKVTYDYTNDVVEDTENNAEENVEESVSTKPLLTGPAFSRYHNKNNRDFSFESSYPDYNKITPSMEPVENTGNGIPDYSMYNGYDPSHICYKCGCITRENGYTFCGKEIPGMGTIGCSSRWGCRTCKKCEEPSNTAPVNTTSDYDCKSCKCLDTNAGKICGRVSRADGFVKKCSSECSKCDACYGKSDSNVVGSNSDNENYLTIEANSNLDRVIINNIKNSDLNDIIEN